MRTFFYGFFYLWLVVSLAGCQRGGDEKCNEEKQGGPTNVDLGNNYYGPANNIPCGDTRTSTYTQATAVAVVVNQTCTNGSVKIEVTPRGGQTTEHVEHGPIIQLTRPREPAVAGDATVVDVPANGTLKVTCDGGAAGSCNVRLRRARSRVQIQGTNYTTASNVNPVCGVAADNAFRNFTSQTQQVVVQFSNVCGRGAIGRRPAPTATPRIMGTPGANPRPQQIQTAQFANGQWTIDFNVPPNQNLSDIKCGHGGNQCIFSIRAKR